MKDEWTIVNQLTNSIRSKGTQSRDAHRSATSAPAPKRQQTLSFRSTGRSTSESQWYQ